MIHLRGNMRNDVSTLGGLASMYLTVVEELVYAIPKSPLNTVSSTYDLSSLKFGFFLLNKPFSYYFLLPQIQCGLGASPK